jgi:hypothetical protein
LEAALGSIKEESRINEEVGTKHSFKDLTVQYGLEGVKAYNFNVVDLNRDGYSDIVIIPSFYSEPQFYYFNIHKKKFELGVSPFSKGVKASFILFYDLNNDKTLDAVLGVLNQKTELSKDPLRVFHGQRNNKKFSFIEKKLSLGATPNSSVGLIDYNLDGKLDFYLGNWFSRYKGNPIPYRDQLFISDGDTYKDRSDLLLGETKLNIDKTMYVNATPTYSVQICDMDQNGFPDIMTTSTNRYKNKLWLNKYKFRAKSRYFMDVGDEAKFSSDADGLINKQGGGRTFGLACADYNNDGIMDVFLGELTHNYDHQGIDKSSILTGRTLKKTPRFFRTEYFVDSLDPNWHQADRRGVWVDIDNDGLLDLLVDNSGYPPHSKLILFKQHPDHSFENHAKKLGIDIVNPMGTVVADFNRDGKMDILTAQSNIRDDSITPRIFLLQNEIDTKKSKTLRFYLRGERSNYHGLNAMVILKLKTAQGIVERRQYVSYSYGALPPQNEEGLHFAIAEGEKVISVSVRWPYTKSINQDSAALEKKYPFKMKFDGNMNITLCENGEYLIGRRDCL